MQNRQLIERFKRAADKIEKIVSPVQKPHIRYSEQTEQDALSTALPELSTSKNARALLELAQLNFGAGAFLKSLKRHGVRMSNSEFVGALTTEFFESTDKALAAFAQLSTAKETESKFILLHAAALKFPDERKLWETLAGALAAGNQLNDAASTYAYQALHLPRSFYNSWNASTLWLQAGDIKEALYFWKHADADASDEHRALAFKPIIAAVRGAPAQTLVENWEAVVPIAGKLPDWIFRRLEACAEVFATGPVVKTGSSDQQARTQHALEQIGLSDAWENGWAHVAPDDVHDTASLLKIAATAARMGDRDTAISIVNGFEGDAVETPSDWLNVAKGYIYLGLFDDALKAIHHIDCTPDDFSELVHEIPDERTDKRVLPLLLEILGRVPGHMGVARRVGDIAMKAGAIDIAHDAFKSVLDTSPDDVDLQYNSSVCLLMQNRNDEAGELLEKVINASPDHAEAHLLRSHLHYQCGDYAAAIDDLIIAEPDIQDLATCRYHLCIAYRANRDHLDASRVARRLLETENLSDSQTSRAQILYLTETALSKDDAARAEVIEFVMDKIEQGPNFGESLLYLVFFFNLGEYELAEKALANLKIIAPKSELVAFWTAYLGYYLDDPALARNIKPRRTHTLEGRLHAIASAAYHVRHGAFDDAMAMLSPIVTTDPTFGRSAYFMSKSMLESGKPQDALAYLSRLVSVGDVRKDLKQLIEDAKACGGDARGQKLAISVDAEKAYGIWQDGEHPFAPIITVGVPSYNETRFLSDALNSVWLQSLPFWQCISVDDCSSDETSDLANDYVGLDPRFAAVTHKENGGLSAARNSALGAANTPYVTFLDGDDYYSINSLWRRTDRLLGEQSNDECAGAYGGIRVTPEFSFGDFPLVEQKTPRKKVTFATVGYEAPFNAHAPVLRTDVMRNVNGFDESMREGAEDWDCWTRILRAGYYFTPTQILCGKYRQKRGSMARSLAPQHVAAAEKIFDQIMSPSSDAKTPVVFNQGFASVNASRYFTNRALRFAAMSQIAGDLDGAVNILSRIPLSLDHIDRIGISISDNVRAGSARFYSDALNTIGGVTRKEFIDRQIETVSEQFRDFLDSRVEIASLSVDESDKGFGSATPAQGTIARRAPAYIKLEERDHRLATVENLRAMRNKHAGERCFIIGNGPSLNDLDLTKIGTEPAIGVNGLFYKCDEINWWPRYYTVEDSSVMNENLERIIAFPAEQKFFPVNYTDLHPHDDNVNFFVMNRGFYEAKSPNFGVPRFSTDFAERAYTGQTVTYINMQLAFHLGFTEVYLIGMDFSYVIPKEFEKKGDMIVSTDDDPNHFHPDYFGKGKSWKDPKLEMVLLNYRMAKLAYEAAGRKIYNATAGGQLELFERKDFNGLF